MEGAREGGGRAEDPFAFALGHVRSGTTMLRAMLDSHSLLAVPPESYFVVGMLRSAALHPTFDFDTFVARLQRDPYFGDWELPVAELEPLREDPRVRTVADAIAGLYARYACVHGKPRYVDKTPSHLLDVELLADRFPRGQFLHIVRDGRDVVASVLTMEFGPSKVADAAWMWRRRVLRAHAVGTRLGPDRYRLIRYEDLVAEPEAVLAGACALFDVPYEPQMLRYHERADELLGGLRHTAHIQGIRRPPTAGVRDWRLDLTPHQIRVFDEIAGDALEQLGYERSGLPRSTAAVAEAYATRLRREARVHQRWAGRRLRAVYRRVRP